MKEKVCGNERNVAGNERKVGGSGKKSVGMKEKQKQMRVEGYKTSDQQFSTCNLSMPALMRRSQCRMFSLQTNAFSNNSLMNNGPWSL